MNKKKPTTENKIVCNGTRLRVATSRPITIIINVYSKTKKAKQTKCETANIEEEEALKKE